MLAAASPCSEAFQSVNVAPAYAGAVSSPASAPAVSVASSSSSSWCALRLASKRVGIAYVSPLATTTPTLTRE